MLIETIQYLSAVLEIAPQAFPSVPRRSTFGGPPRNDMRLFWCGKQLAKLQSDNPVRKKFTKIWKRICFFLFYMVYYMRIMSYHIKIAT